MLHYRKHILASMDRMSVEHRDADSREKYSIGFWGKYADTSYIHKEGDADLEYTGNTPRLDNIQLPDKIHNSRSLQEQFIMIRRTVTATMYHHLPDLDIRRYSKDSHCMVCGLHIGTLC